MTRFNKGRFLRAGAILTAAAVWGFGTVAPVSGQRPEGSEAARGAEQQKAEEQDSRPSLRFGEPTRPREREATIPIHFVPRRDRPVGSVWTDITIPSGPWRFQRAEAAPRSGWRISATQKRQPGRATPAAGAPTEIELTVTAGRRTIPEGLLGYLRFRLDSTDSPLPGGLSVTKIETAVPSAEDAQAPAAFPPTFSDPTLAPGVGCFFFTH
jgi:hypothetical protein